MHDSCRPLLALGVDPSTVPAMSVRRLFVASAGGQIDERVIVTAAVGSPCSHRHVRKNTYLRRFAQRR